MNFILKKNRLFKERPIHSNRTLKKLYSLSQEKSSTFILKKSVHLYCSRIDL